MKIETTLEGDILTATPQIERLDSVCTVAFKEQMHISLAPHQGRVILDMAQIQFMDSSGLGALVAVMKTLDAGRRLELRHCAPPVMRVLTLTRMDRIFVIHGDASDATGSAA